MGFMDKIQAKMMTAGSRPQSQQSAPAPPMPVAPAPVGPRFDASSFKRKLKIGKTRAEVQQGKVQNAAHKTRQAVVTELRANKSPTACIKMEQYLRETAQTESHDVLMAHIERLIARVSLIESTPQFDDLPDDVKEAIASMVYGSARLSNAELRDATAQLRALYTPNIIDPLTSASGPYAHHVDNILARRMDATPDDYVILDGLKQIAAEENITTWHAPAEPQALRMTGRGGGGGPGGLGGVAGFPQGPGMPMNVPGPSAPAAFMPQPGGPPPAGPPPVGSDMPPPMGPDYGTGWGGVPPGEGAAPP